MAELKLSVFSFIFLSTVANQSSNAFYLTGRSKSFYSERFSADSWISQQSFQKGVSVSDKVTKWAVLLNDSLNAHNMCVLWQQWKLIYFDLFPFTSNPTLIIVWWNENTICKFSTICDHQDSDDQKRKNLKNYMFSGSKCLWIHIWRQGETFFISWRKKSTNQFTGKWRLLVNNGKNVNLCIFLYLSICYQKDD